MVISSCGLYFFFLRRFPPLLAPPPAVLGWDRCSLAASFALSSSALTQRVNAPHKLFEQPNKARAYLVTPPCAPRDSLVFLAATQCEMLWPLPHVTHRAYRACSPSACGAGAIALDPLVHRDPSAACSSSSSFSASALPVLPPVQLRCSSCTQLVNYPLITSAAFTHSSSSCASVTGSARARRRGGAKFSSASGLLCVKHISRIRQDTSSPKHMLTLNIKH